MFGRGDNWTRIDASLAAVIAVMATLWVANACIARADSPDAETARALEDWQSLRFGLFIHWGPVALRGTELSWSRGKDLSVEAYDALYKEFNPTQFDANRWAAIAKQAGMKYVVLAAKHHDGFCLWPTKYSDYDIAATPFHRDVVGELAGACGRQGLQFSTYYSLPDWRGPDYALLSPGGSVKNPHPNMAKHFQLIKDQTKELLDNYGPLGVMWFDGDWEEPWTREYGDELYAYLKQIQPSLIINNRISKGRLTKDSNGMPAGKGDFDTPEQHIGEFNRDMPWETCMTLGQQWSWKPNDNLKSAASCIQTLIKTAGGDGNLLLNVGPMPSGEIEPRQVDLLREIGSWLAKYGDCIYATRGGPFKPGEWGASTCKDDKIYLFITAWPHSGPLILPAIDANVIRARSLTGGNVSVKATSRSLEVTAPSSDRDAIATVIELKVDDSTTRIEPRAVIFHSDSLACGRPTRASNEFAGMTEYGAARATDDDPSTRWATDSGGSSAWLEVDLGAPATIDRVDIDEPGEYQRVQSFQLEGFDGRAWKMFWQGTTIGPKWSQEVAPVAASRVRLTILKTADGPTINEFRVFGARTSP